MAQRSQQLRLLPRSNLTSAKCISSPHYYRGSGTPKRVIDLMYLIDLRPQPHTNNSIHHIKIMKYIKSPISTMLSRALNFSKRNGKSRKWTERPRQAETARRKHCFRQGIKRTQLRLFAATVMPQPLPSWKPPQKSLRVCKVSVPLRSIREDSYSSPT